MAFCGRACFRSSWCSIPYNTFMAHLTIYLSDEVEQQARKAAKAAKTSMSKWIANQIETAVKTSWSPEFLEAAGSVPDFPELDELRKGYGSDVRRENLD